MWGVMTKEEFKAARLQLGLTQKRLAEELKLSLRCITHYEGGTRPIPGIVSVAMGLLMEGRQ